MTMEYDSPRVQRCMTPSPLRATPARSRNQLCDLYTSSPRFLLDALEEASYTSVPTDLPKHYLPNFPIRVVKGHSDPIDAEMREIGSHFPGCCGIAYQVIDITSYKATVRPGILLESKRGFGTTSRILLLGPDGKRWFTVTEHGFKVRGNQEVYHPSYMVGNSLIGIVTDIKEYKFFGSDIRLAQLKDGITYSDVFIDADEVDGTKFEGLVRSGDTAIGDRIFMDSPYNGRCEGVLGWRGVNMIDPVDHDSPKFTFLHTSMIYFGNRASHIFPRTCGSTLWTN